MFERGGPFVLNFCACLERPQQVPEEELAEPAAAWRLSRGLGLSLGHLFLRSLTKLVSFHLSWLSHGGFCVSLGFWLVRLVAVAALSWELRLPIFAALIKGVVHVSDGFPVLACNALGDPRVVIRI